MKENLEFYRCSKCGNIVTKLFDSGAKIVCCGSEMEILNANSVDAAVEKHVPFYNEASGQLKINVGETIHPMLSEHYIQFIVATDGEYVLLKKLKPNDVPELNLEIDLKKLKTSYEYCNVHGLWKGIKN